MRTPWQYIRVPFIQGIDTKSDEKVVGPGYWTDMQNAVFVRPGTISKRYGLERLGNAISASTTTVSGAVALFAQNDELVLVGDEQLYSYTSGDEWRAVDSFIPCALSQRTVVKTTSEQTLADHASVDGISLYAWQDSRGGVRYSLEDASTGTVFLGDQALSSTATKPRCLAVGGFLQLLYMEEAEQKLYVKVFAPANIVSSASDAAKVVADDLASSNPMYDVLSLGARGLFVYSNATSELKIGYLTAAGLVGGPGNGGLPSAITETLPGALHAVSLAYQVSEDMVAVVFWVTGDALTASVYTGQLADKATAMLVGEMEDSTLTITNITAVWRQDREYTATPYGDVFRLDIFFEASDTVSYNHAIYKTWVHTDGTTPGGGEGGADNNRWLRHHGLASHAFLNDAGTLLVNVVHDSTHQATYFLVDAEARPVARVLPGVAGSLTTNYLPRVEDQGDNSFLWVGAFKNRQVIPGSASTYTEKGIKLITYDFAFEPQPVEYRGVTYLPGAVLSEYDSHGVVENNFLLYPENMTASGVSGGNLTADSTYNYQLYWEWYDARNKRHLSTTASGLSIALSGAEQSVVLTVPTLTMTRKRSDLVRDDVRLAVYRGAAGDADELLRVDDLASPTFNDPSVNTITYTDTLADTSLAGEPDYQVTGSELEHVAPLSCRVLAESKERLFAAGLPENDAVLYSKLLDGTWEPSFNDGLSVTVGADGGSITAVETLDSALIIFKRTRIYATVGDGLNDTGLSGGFQGLSQVPADVGCISAMSLVKTHLGLMFQSAKGIYLLDRQLKVSYIGAPVEAYNSQTITAATLVEKHNEVRFLTDSGRTLVYDYEQAQWTTFAAYTGAGATLYSGDYVVVSSAGRVSKESTSSYADGAKHVPMVFESAWYRLGNGIQEGICNSVVLLGKFLSSHILKLEVAWDYREHYDHTIYFDPSGAIQTSTWEDDVTDTWAEESSPPWGQTSNTVYELRAYLRRDRGQAVRFRLSDIRQGSSGASFELTEMVLEVLPPVGTVLLPGTQQTG